MDAASQSASRIRIPRSPGIRIIRARRFYEKTGFLQGGVRKGYYRDPPEDAFCTVCDLRKPS